MPTLSQSQYDTLKNKGLDDTKIQELAKKNGYELPKQSFVKSLIKSEIGFGQSMAGALGNVLPSSWTGKKAIDESNKINQQVQTNLINKIKEKKAKGEDTSRLINALKTLDKEVNFYDILNSSTGGSLDKSAKQVFGEGLGVATDILGAGALPGGIGQVAKAKTIMGGIKAGATAGAIGGGIFGTSKGATTAMQDNLSGGEIIGKGIRGGVEGAVGGAIAGGVLGGVSGGIRGREVRKMNRAEKFALDLVSPEQTKEIREQAIKQGTLGLSEPGFIKKGKILATKRDVALADSIKDMVSKDKTVLQNVDVINSRIDNLNTGIKNYVKQNKVPFNEGQLRTQLQKGRNELKLIFASDSNAEKTYNAVVDEFVDLVKKGDTEGLLNARQAFDKIPSIQKLLNSQGLAENVKREVVFTARDQANKYVSSLLPKNNPYKPILLRESKMIEALGNIASKNRDMVDANKIRILLQKHPSLKWVLGTVGAGATAAGIANL